MVFKLGDWEETPGSLGEGACESEGEDDEPEFEELPPWEEPEGLEDASVEEPPLPWEELPGAEEEPDWEEELGTEDG